MNYVMRVRAFAKINLSLRVLGASADGYHDLRTIFQSIALHDTLTIRAARGPFRVTCDDPSCPTDDTNLVWRAANHLWQAAGRRGILRDVSIDVKKRIPLQAGLGGGSSDAAAALRALGRLWRVDERRVRAAAGGLGADIPYFLEGGTVLGLERGDLLFPLVDPPKAWVVLVLPPFGVSTKEAFGWWDADTAAHRGGGADPRVRPGADTGVGPNGVHEFVNDLEAPVASRHAAITRAVAALRKAGAAHAAMSGSGSAVFGLFVRQSDASRAARALAGRTRTTLVTRTLNRSKYQTLAAPEPIG